jgi:hypothetical protein
MRIVFLLPIVLLTFATRCLAFDAWGFVSGENKAEVERRAKEHGDTVQQVDSLTVINRLRPGTGRYDTYHLTFCDDRLAGLTKIESFTPSIIVDVISDLVKQYGTPEISVSDRTIHAFTDFDLKEVDYTWDSANDRIQVAMNVPTAPLLQLVPGITVTHSDTAKCRLKPDADHRDALAQ